AASVSALTRSRPDRMRDASASTGSTTLATVSRALKRRGHDRDPHSGRAASFEPAGKRPRRGKGEPRLFGEVDRAENRMQVHVRADADLSIAYRVPVEDVLAALDSDARQGLTAAEARARLARVGPNELPAEPPIPAWRRVLAQFRDVLVILLLVATAVSAV